MNCFYSNKCLYRLEENGVVTDCHIKTLEPDETLDFNFNSGNVINKIIMKVGVGWLLLVPEYHVVVFLHENVYRVVLFFSPS